MSDKVSYEEQEAAGLIRKRQTFVPPAKQEIVRKVTSIPVVVDPYVESAMPAEMVTQYHADPITRYKAMVGKANSVSVFLGLLTGAFMLVFQWYPHDLDGLYVMLLWLGLASLEWVLLFVMLAVIDYKETPSAQNWYKMKALVRFMGKEQDHRLREMYPDQYDDQGRRKW
jgi:hypothetical protein